MSCILILYELSGQLHVCVSCVQYSSTCTYVLKFQTLNTGLLLPLIYSYCDTKIYFLKTLIEHSGTSGV